jgi:hypothetical protein
VNDPLRHDESLSLSKVDRPALQVDDEATLEDKEELIVVVVLVPVILTLQDAKSNDRVVHFAEGLVVPMVGAGVNQRGNVNQAQ